MHCLNRCNAFSVHTNWPRLPSWKPRKAHWRSGADRLLVRLAEWPVEFFRRPKRTPRTIPDFLSPDAPPNRLAILRGLEKAP